MTSKLLDCVESVKEKPEVRKEYMMLEEYVYYERKEAAEEAIISNTRENIMELLEDLGEIPEDIREQINEQQDVEILKKWLKAAPKAKSFEEFREETGKKAVVDVKSSFPF